jgi:hypothetical protein
LFCRASRPWQKLSRLLARVSCRSFSRFIGCLRPNDAFLPLSSTCLFARTPELRAVKPAAASVNPQSPRISIHVEVAAARNRKEKSMPLRHPTATDGQSGRDILRNRNTHEQNSLVSMKRSLRRPTDATHPENPWLYGCRDSMPRDFCSCLFVPAQKQLINATHTRFPHASFSF